MLLLLIAALLLPGEAAISCKGPRNSNVDWFIVYKMPGGGKNPESGRTFYYLDNKKPNWTLGTGLIDAKDQPVGATISQVYDADKDSFFFMYNDDGPNKKADSYRGHAKGVVLFDKKKGFWMVHSAPNFPEQPYAYPNTATKFGQAFICVTLATAALSDVGEHLRFIQATPFQSNLPDLFATKFPVLRNVVNKQSLPSSATVFNSSHQLKTVNGITVLSFAKHKRFNKDLWLDLVAKETGTNLAVQSWLNGGADDLRSQCDTGRSVYDVERISLAGNVFNSTRDHSKWAVGDSANVPIVCVGDINRQTSQFRRGGGALCLLNHELWLTFRSSVIQVEPCIPKGNKSLIYTIFLVSFAFYLL